MPAGGHPYDALLQLSEPGTTLASLRELFAELKAGITPILREAAANPPRTGAHNFLNTPLSLRRFLI